MKKLRYIIEYLLLRIVLALVDVLPFAMAAGFARFLADLYYCFNKERRNIAVDNIKRAGIAEDDRKAASIAKASMRHFAVLIIESIEADRFFDEESWLDQVEMDIPAETLELLKKPGVGVLLVSGHLGNWEVAAQLLSALKPVTAITRDMNNPYSNNLMLKRKSREHLTLTPKHSADGSRFMKVLKNGEVLALLNDQYARDRGMKIDFFGIPAETHTAVAMLHFITKAPICFGYCVRTGKMKFKFKALKPMVFEATGDRKADTRNVLESINRELESAIREYPEQYLWAHKRWK